MFAHSGASLDELEDGAFPIQTFPPANSSFAGFSHSLPSMDERNDLKSAIRAPALSALALWAYAGYPPGAEEEPESATPSLAERNFIDNQRAPFVDLNIENLAPPPPLAPAPAPASPASAFRAHVPPPPHFRPTQRRLMHSTSINPLSLIDAIAGADSDIVSLFNIPFNIDLLLSAL